MEASIVYEDEYVLAVNKPSGLVVHPDGRSAKLTAGRSATGPTREKTLVDWVLENRPALKNVGEPAAVSGGQKVVRPGIVHRLDKDTSGILLLAKTQETFLFLKRQFAVAGRGEAEGEKGVLKAYRAVVYGELKEKRGRIDKPMARSRKDFRQRTGRERQMRGTVRSALTEYTLLAKNKDYSYVEAYPRTGRTHQLRVHLKEIGHPVVCDDLYAPKRQCPGELGRLALHAFAITFTHPDGARMRLEAPLPEEIKRFAERAFKLRPGA